MEVPIINNLNDNGDRQRPKGKDVFKDQQKESEVNRRCVCVQSATTAHSVAAHWRCVCLCMYVCMYVCVCVVAGELSDQLNVLSMQSVAVLAREHARMQTGRQADTEVLFWQPAPINNPAVILQWCSGWRMQVVKCDCCCQEQHYHHHHHHHYKTHCVGHV